MAKIYAPNKAYNGVTASVPFVSGVGETDNPALIRWFTIRGYRVEEAKPAEPPEKPQGSGKPAVPEKPAPKK